MNREMWFRILQVAVVAPYLYKVSATQKGYFSIGLKMVAGSIIMLNLKPLSQDFATIQAQAKTFVANLAKAQETLAKNNKRGVTIDAENAETVDAI